MCSFEMSAKNGASRAKTVQAEAGVRSRWAMLDRMDSAVGAPPAPQLRERVDIPPRFKWNLTHIFADWAGWEEAYRTLETKIAAYAVLQGTLTKGADHLLAAMKLSDDIGQ